jgi:hypothetical protein
MDMDRVRVYRLSGNAAHLSHRDNQCGAGVRVVIRQWWCRSLVFALHFGESLNRICLLIIVNDGMVVGAK